MLKRVVIRNFMGITFREITLPPHGVVIQGTNAEGKTSFLEAIRVGLLNVGAKPSMVRKGADESILEFVVDGTEETGDITIRRRLTPDDNNTLTVKDAFNVKITKPQSFLNELLGIAPIDALALWTDAKPRERRERVMSSVPLNIPEADLRALLDDYALEDFVRRKPDGSLDLDRHGAVIIAEIAEAFYDKRTIANRAVKDAEKAAAEAQTALREKESAFRQKALASGMMAGEAEMLNVQVIEQDLSNAQGYKTSLTERLKLAHAANEKTAATKQRIETLNAKRTELRALTWSDQAKADEAAAADAHAVALRVHTEASEAVEKARAALRLAEEHERQARIDLDKRAEQHSALKAQRDLIAKNEADAKAIDEQIDALESAIGAATQAAPGQDEMVEADGKVAVLAARLALAKDAVALRSARGAYDATQSEASRAKQAAELLDTLVHRWQTTIPAEAFAKYSGIPGLSFGDDVMLDGIPIGQLSGRERLQFCIEIARRGNTKSRMVVQDGLEAVAPDILPYFLTQATRDGYQLIVTRVDRGELTFIPIDEFLASHPATSSAILENVA
ncbi:hypothetical protein EKK58_05460 [Candidatus Dependentiae bacterium]|nr:MAG: hypothetical protein EKK58_05460 [Candidatus Dependentiae bacterium]